MDSRLGRSEFRVGKKTGQNQLSSVLISLYDFRGKVNKCGNEQTKKWQNQIPIRKHMIWSIKNSTATKRNLFVNNMISTSLKNATGLF